MTDAAKTGNRSASSVANTPAYYQNSQTQWIDTQRASMRYTDSGGQGVPLFLLHEMGGSLESWDPVLTQLPESRRVIRCDMRGAGGSESIREQTNCDELMEDLVALLDALGVTEPADVAGVAIGGCLALRLAATHPGRVHRVAAINPPTDAHGRSGEVLRERAASVDAAGMRSVVESTFARSYPDYLRGDDGTYQTYVARFITNDPQSYAYILRALANVDFDAVLESIGCPVIFLSGHDDLVRRPEQIQEVAKRVKGARFQEIAGGHIPSVQAPEALANALNAFFSN
jgi:3-oxoadipate enol-lactonase